MSKCVTMDEFLLNSYADAMFRFYSLFISLLFVPMAQATSVVGINEQEVIDGKIYEYSFDPNKHNRLLDLKSFHIHLGVLSAFHDTIQIDEFGQRNSTRAVPFLGYGLAYRLPNQMMFSPNLLLTIPQNNDDRTITHMQAFIRLPFETPWFWRIKPTVGSSLALNIMHGKGGQKTLRNGNSESEFFVPSATRTSINNTFDFGFKFKILKNWQLHFDSMTYALFDDNRRATTYLLNIIFIINR